MKSAASNDFQVYPFKPCSNNCKQEILTIQKLIYPKIFHFSEYVTLGFLFRIFAKLHYQKIFELDFFHGEISNQTWQKSQLLSKWPSERKTGPDNDFDVTVPDLGCCTAL